MAVLREVACQEPCPCLVVVVDGIDIQTLKDVIDGHDRHLVAQEALADGSRPGTRRRHDESGSTTIQERCHSIGLEGSAFVGVMDGHDETLRPERPFHASQDASVEGLGDATAPALLGLGALLRARARAADQPSG